MFKPNSWSVWMSATILVVRPVRIPYPMHRYVWCVLLLAPVFFRVTWKLELEHIIHCMLVFLIRTDVPFTKTLTHAHPGANPPETFPQGRRDCRRNTHTHTQYTASCLRACLCACTLWHTYAYYAHPPVRNEFGRDAQPNTRNMLRLSHPTENHLQQPNQLVSTPKT